MGRPQSELTKFILSIPADVPTKTVVEQAQKKGLTTTESNVLRVRGIAKRGASKRPAASKKAAKTVAEQPPAAAQTAPLPAPPAAVDAVGSSAAASKSDFIRAQPASLSAGEVVAAGKAAGITFESYLVYKVRAAQRDKAAKKPAERKTLVAKVPAPKAAVTRPAAQKKTAAKKTVAPRKSTLSASDFIRSQPVDLSAAEVVSNARKVGIKLKAGLVYQVRRVARGHVAATAAAPSRAAPKPAVKRQATSKVAPKPVTKPAATRVVARAVPNGPTTSAEDLLRAVAAEIGLGRAIFFLEEQRHQVLRVLGG